MLSEGGGNWLVGYKYFFYVYGFRNEENYQRILKSNVLHNGKDFIPVYYDSKKNRKKLVVFHALSFLLVAEHP